MSLARGAVAAILFGASSLHGPSAYPATRSIEIASDRWHQLSVPGDPAGETLASLFGDDIDVDDYASTWIAWRYAADESAYARVETDEALRAGDALWFIQRTGADVTLTLPDELPPASGTNMAGCDSAAGCLALPLRTRSGAISWHMLGSPFGEPVAEEALAFVRGRGEDCVDGCTIAEAGAKSLTSSTAFLYDPVSEDYEKLSDAVTLDPWQGVWFATSPDPLGSGADAALLIPAPASCPAAGCGSVTLGGRRVKWHPLTVDVAGPTASERDTAPNPFLDVRLEVRFTAPSGNRIVAPGFFAGDGRGGGTGNLWRVRFAPDEAGSWTYAVSFRRGDDVAVSPASTPGTALAPDGATARFTVAGRDAGAPGLLADGRLDYIGGHYLKQADGEHWIKGGVDSPENFFGYAGFDNTFDQPGGVSSAGLQDGVHRYAPHVRDWNAGDPNFVSADTGIDAKGIIGAVNYLSEQQVNSIYFLPMNLGGDGRETYPFVGASGSAFDDTHYDVSKLHQWNIVLDHMQRKGIAAHMVLGEQERGNTNWLDGGELGVERKLYYRELIARFGYLNGIKWNLGEESRYGAARHRAFAAYIRALDWADHQIAVHTMKNDPAGAYVPLLGNPDFDTSSIQFSPANADDYVETWRRRTREAGVSWIIEMDEIGSATKGLTDDNADALRGQVLYPTLFSGGHIEWYFGYHDLPLGGDIRTENFRTREAMFRYMRHARTFMQDELPFWEMEPNDGALSGGRPGDQAFEKPGESYALYLEDGADGRTLAVVAGAYSVRWFDPRGGRFVGAAGSRSGARLALGAAPGDTSEDWVVLVRRSGS